MYIWQRRSALLPGRQRRGKRWLLIAGTAALALMIPVVASASPTPAATANSGGIASKTMAAGRYPAAVTAAWVPGAAAARPRALATRGQVPAGTAGVPGLDDRVMAIQHPLDRAAAQLERLAKRQSLAGFTGTALDLTHRKVVLYWHGTVPATEMALVAGLRRTVAVEVRAAPYSLATLAGEARRILLSGQAPGRARVAQVSVLPDFSGLTVTFNGPAGGHGRVTAAMARQVASPVKTILTSGPPVTLLSCPDSCPGGRWNDQPPFKGGAAIKGLVNGQLCSTGFEAYHAGDFITGLLTAEHCEQPHGIQEFISPGNQFDFGTSAGCCASADTMPITYYKALPNPDYAPYIYVGPYTSSATSPVVDSGTNPVGAQRCLGGAFTGEICGNTVVSPLVMVLNGGGAIAGVWLQNNGHIPAAGNGDSGGPAYTVDPATGDITAMGIIEAGDLSTPYNTGSCSGIASGNGRGCSWRIMIVDMDSALNSINAGLVVAPPRCASTTDTLQANQSLSQGQCLHSQNGLYTLQMQGDGNLVLYAEGAGQPRVLWDSGTQGNPNAYALMQGDGNLVIYLQGGQRALWSSKTQGNPGAYLIMQNDGNLVIYRQGGTAIWATGTQQPN